MEREETRIHFIFWKIVLLCRLIIKRMIPVQLLAECHPRQFLSFSILKYLVFLFFSCLFFFTGKWTKRMTKASNIFLWIGGSFSFINVTQWFPSSYLATRLCLVIFFLTGSLKKFNVFSGLSQIFFFFTSGHVIRHNKNLLL